MTVTRPCVLVFAGHDPSGGAGIQADSEAIAAQGAHALTVITALTVQDHNRAYAVQPLAPSLILTQADTLLAATPVAAIKLGIVGSLEVARALAGWIAALKQRAGYAHLPVLLDPVLGSGHGDALARDDAVATLQPLLRVATLITPNLPEVARLCPGANGTLEQAQRLLQHACQDVLIKGGHGDGAAVRNLWFGAGRTPARQCWNWPRLPGAFHGSGCTLAAAIAGQLACGKNMEQALQQAQEYTQRSLQHAYAIADGQLIPQRFLA